MRAINAREYLTDRERAEFDHESELAKLQANYGLQIKKLELELRRTESNWNQVWRLPLALINLPVRILFAFGFIVLCIVKKEPTDKFWDFLHG